ncbi:Chromo domain-containing protein [Cucumis melo var. makuwa]|uniref:Chromo domain-containing protein n=1 Tax=Cucumis melo var. makuwa TaxID=1194695 RepID=A0A5D3CKK0_CUCMM|nr:Chromo domain-containing protein [Cucumis melo var. makuwa]
MVFTTEDQLCSFGIKCCTCSGMCQFLGEGKGRGKLASDREGSVTCHMGTQFCFCVYVLEVKMLRSRGIALVKVLWQNHGVEETTWEREDYMKAQYPELHRDLCTKETQFFLETLNAAAIPLSSSAVTAFLIPPSIHRPSRFRRCLRRTINVVDPQPVIRHRVLAHRFQPVHSRASRHAWIRAASSSRSRGASPHRLAEE